MKTLFEFILKLKIKGLIGRGMSPLPLPHKPPLNYNYLNPLILTLILMQEALDLIAVRPLNIMALVDEESKFPKVKYFFSSFCPPLNPIIMIQIIYIIA